MYSFEFKCCFYSQGASNIRIPPVQFTIIQKSIVSILRYSKNKTITMIRPLLKIPYSGKQTLAVGYIGQI